MEELAIGRREALRLGGSLVLAGTGVALGQEETKKGLKDAMEMNGEGQLLWNLPNGDIPLGTKLLIPIGTEENPRTATLIFNAEGLPFTLDGQQCTITTRGMTLPITLTVKTASTRMDTVNGEKTLIITGTAATVEGVTSLNQAQLKTLIEHLLMGKSVGITLKTQTLGDRRGIVKPKKKD